MSAWRSLLSRSHPLLSRLRPARRHAIASHLPPIGANSHLIASRRYASNGDSHAEVNRQHPAAQERQKRHLYVVLDDHKDSYGIHKLDMDDHSDDLDGGHPSSPRRFPVLPALSMARSTLSEWAKFTAVGSSIVAIGRKPQGSTGEDDGRVLIYDTKEAKLLPSPRIPQGLEYGYEAAMAAGQRLYFLESVSGLHSLHRDQVHPGGEYRYMYHGALHCLHAADPPDDHVEGLGNKLWTWSTDDRLLGVPFRANTITGHAVHAPPVSVAVHHDIYVSALVDTVMPKGVTFSFSTASGKWTRHGYWQLPVVGHAHYDDQLGAWLGLHSGEGSINSRRLVDGHLCAGNIASAPPEWKVGTEKLFHREEDMEAGWRNFDAKLVPMAPGEGGSEYCLMERLRPEGDVRESFGDGDKWLLRLTAFRVERGQDGLPVVTARRPVRCYKMSRYNKYFDAQAFWL
ncbi:hypothetical protein D1007_42893 [Hordeum vulgare]|nr:hypothetical protein D1007_42893 [Hordeum vulgare]